MNFPVSFPGRTSLLIVLLSLFIQKIAHSQDTTRAVITGSVKGTVKDSTHNVFLQSATVAIYRSEDSSLIKYQLTNNFGGFQLSGLPLNTGLKLVVSYTGYKSLSRAFILTKDNRLLDLKELIVDRGAEMMEEVVVKTVPPVRVNGDTLEFNAAAFSLDKNAVAEDLLKRLPGVIVWGDGTITVNGKQIKQLLVEGKPFFGDDARIATQNLPKDAIQKVQIYKEQVNPYNPLDSITTMNVKLKANSRKGHFGEIAAGYGTDKQYQFDGSVNFYSPRDLIGVAASSNNVNKLPTDIYSLMRNSTYKGVSANVDYQPDFTLQGVNKSNSGGLVYQHDFIPDASSYKQNRLTASGFVNNVDNVTQKISHTLSSVGDDSLLTSDNNNNSHTRNTLVDLESKYELKRDENTLNIGVSGQKSQNKAQLEQDNVVYTSGPVIENFQSAKDSLDTRSGSLAFSIDYNHVGFSGMNSHRLTNWQAQYSLDVGNNDTSRLLRENFNSPANPAASQNFLRTYENDNNHVRQKLALKAGDFANWFFGHNNRLSNYSIVGWNDLSMDIQTIDNTVRDGDSIDKIFRPNTYLSNKGTYRVIDEAPNVSISRTFNTILANRYQKTIVLDLTAAMHFYSEDNTSDHNFLRYTREYNRPAASAGVAFSNYRFSSYLNNFDVHFKTHSGYPGLYQLYPLVDSTPVYTVRFGNPNLLPYSVNEIAINFRHDGYRSKNTFNYGFRFKVSAVSHYLADSAILDRSGRYFYYTVNMPGYRDLNLGAFLNKAFKAAAHQIQLSFMPYFDYSRVPGYVKLNNNVDAVKNLSNVLLNNDTLSVSYTWRDLVAINLSEIFTYFHSSQAGLTNNTFSNELSQTRLGVGVAVTKKLMLHSSVSHNRSTSSGLPATVFTLWNADAAYRFLPDNTMELKFSALDLLHQNKGILNYGSAYSLTHSSVNVLQQYFMVTLAYYPRKFNRNKPAPVK